ncbi:unnamed protein product [Rhizophagus irregularis]|uniref:Uncharacterized protein n=1 Tax=Rhizophagus irregularis TaxID=588596 RepID=A0A2N1MBV1_9GLOM|nr:hypothetical protein RhiirC2_795324 [Rhizophagus irregularis]CAB5364531.1 unnamed protein product [Rhizophagus irregularis]
MDIKAYNSITVLEMFLCSCRIWIEDTNGYRIAGDSNYHDCTYNTHGEEYTNINFPNQTYSVHAKVQGSLRKQKIRGPFNENTCFSIHGSVDKWGFDQKSC